MRYAVVLFNAALLSLLSLASCGPGWMESRVRADAADRFGCHEKQVRVEEIASDRYKARGCGHTAFYRCVDRGTTAPTCSAEK